MLLSWQKHKIIIETSQSFKLYWSCLRNIGDYHKAIEYFYRALTVATENKVLVEQGYAYNNIGDIHRIQNHSKAALSYIHKAIRIFELLDIQTGIAYAYIRMGELHQHTQNYDSALFYFQKCLSIRKALDDKSQLGTAYERMGACLLEVEQLEEGMNMIDSALFLAYSIDNKKGIATSREKLARYYFKVQDFTHAINEGKLSLQAARLIDDKPLQLSLSELLSSAYKTKQNYKDALIFQELHNALSDSVNRAENSRQLELLSLQNVMHQREMQIAKDKELSRLTRNALLIAFLLVSSIVGLLFYYWRKGQRTNRLLNLKNTVINKKNKEITDANKRLVAHEEELMLQTEELQSVNENLEKALQRLKSTQTQLIESEKMAVLGQLMAGVAHEVNTPLGAIRSSINTLKLYLKEVFDHLPKLTGNLSPEMRKLFFQIVDLASNNKKVLSTKERREARKALVLELEEKGFKDPKKLAIQLVDFWNGQNIESFLPILQHNKSEELLNMINKLSGIFLGADNIYVATERASKVVFALKAYAHYNESGDQLLTNVEESLDNVLTLYRNQIRNIELIKKYEGVPEIYCYVDELGQVWTNLIHNALQAMEFNGQLKVTTSSSEQFVIVEIEDSGVGIPTEIQDKVFQPFFTTKDSGEGTGLGLDIVKRIVEKHFGEIGFREGKSSGTCFWVKLPINQELIMK